MRNFHGIVFQDVFLYEDKCIGRFSNLHQRTFNIYYTCETIVRLGTETVTYRGPQIWNLIPDDIKNVSSHVKRQERNQKMETRKVPM